METMYNIQAKPNDYWKRYKGCKIVIDYGRNAEFGIHIDTIDYIGEDYCRDSNGYIHYLTDFKLILTPMSMLTKEELIESGFDSHIDYLTHEEGDPLNAPFKMIAYLIDEGYDVFKLIESGFAIDKNELK